MELTGARRTSVEEAEAEAEAEVVVEVEVIVLYADVHQD